MAQLIRMTYPWILTILTLSYLTGTIGTPNWLHPQNVTVPANQWQSSHKITFNKVTLACFANRFKDIQGFYKCQKRKGTMIQFILCC